jgi:hypothetical protein
VTQLLTPAFIIGHVRLSKSVCDFAPLSALHVNGGPHYRPGTPRNHRR